MEGLKFHPAYTLTSPPVTVLWMLAEARDSWVRDKRLYVSLTAQPTTSAYLHQFPSPPLNTGMICWSQVTPARAVGCLIGKEPRVKGPALEQAANKPFLLHCDLLKHLCD